MPTLNELLLQKEGTTLEFKRTLDNAQKIARTLAAFANTSGGYLVVGVEDDLRVTGVKSELAELNKIAHATEFLVEPPLDISYKVWEAEGRQVLVFSIAESTQKPHKARNNAGAWEVYVRAKDKTVPVSKRMASWLEQKTESDKMLLQQPPIRTLVTFLQKNDHITVDKYAKLVNISVHRAEKLLKTLVSQGILLELDKHRPKAFCLKKWVVFRENNTNNGDIFYFCFPKDSLTMKQFFRHTCLLLIVFAVTSCVSTQKYDDIVEQNHKLQSQLEKERDENAQLSSFRFSLENQFREKAKQYQECQETSKETVESMAARYNQLNADYQKLTDSYKKLNELYEQTRQNDALLIADLEKRLRESLSRRRRRG